MKTRLLLIMGILFWSSNYVIGRLVVGVIPPLTLSFVRWLLSVLIFLPFCRSEMRESYPKIKGHWPLFIFMGFVGYVGYTNFQYLALKHTTAINANIINSSTPMFTAIGAYLFLKDKLRPIQILGIFLAFSGVAWIITRGSIEYLLTLSFNSGDLFMIGAVLIQTSYLLTLRVKGRLIPPNSFYLYCVAGGVLATLPLAAIELSQTGWEWVLQLKPLHIGSILYFAIFPSILSMLFFNKAIVDLGPVKAAIYLNLGIFFTTVLGMIFLKEHFYLTHLLGGCLIICGVWLTNKQPEKVSAVRPSGG